MRTAEPSLFKKILALLGPGIFLIGYNIGTGSVTTMASAGSRWGMSLTWTVVLSCLFSYIGIYVFSRYTLVTGDTILYAIKKRLVLGKQISLFIMCAIILAEIVGVTGLMSIIVDLLREWTGLYSPAAKLAMTLILSGIVFTILWMGQYSYLEKLLAVLVSVMGASFLLTAVLVVPSWKDILTGLVPAMPPGPDSSLIVAGMSGTTFGSAMLYCRSITIKEKGWGIAQERTSRYDALTSVSLMFFLSFAVMTCAAGTLHVMSRPVVNAIDMVKTLEPLAGKWAISLFNIGVVGAGISSLIPTVLIAPWLISDYTNRPINPRSLPNRIFVTIGTLLAITGPYLKANPVSLMIATMALLAIILPLSTIGITFLLNQNHMGEYKNSLLMNVACGATILFSLVMAYYGVLGIFEKIG